jgi:hypothetical protein
MGVTKAQLSPIIQAYNNYNQTVASANHYLANPQVAHNRFSDDNILFGVQAAKSVLDSAIDTSLKEAANGTLGNKPNWAAFFKDVSARAQNIVAFGPQDSQFAGLVNEEAKNFAVTQATSSVATAYGSGGVPGATAAAAQLATVTAAAGNPDTALAIIQASNNPGSLGPNSSQSILGAISSQLTALATNLGTGTSETDFDQIYTDLSAAAGAATVVTPHFTPQGQIASFTQSTAASDIVGGDIAAAAPKNPAQWVSQFYESGANAAIATNGFAGVTLATAAALAKQGNTGMASALVTGATQGFQSLKGETDSDVQAYGNALSPLYTLQTTWGPFMTGAGLTAATNSYLADHKGVVTTANQDLATISQNGDAILMAESAWGAYGMPAASGLPGPGSALHGIDGVGDLSQAATALTGNDPSTAFAVSRSDSLNQIFLTELAPPSSSNPSGGTLFQTLWHHVMTFTQQAGADAGHWVGFVVGTLESIAKTPGVDRATRSLVSAALKSLAENKKNAAVAAAAAAGPNEKPASTPTYAVPGLLLSLVGVGLTVANGYSQYKQVTLFKFDPEDLAYSTYTALGFAKYAGETYSGLYKSGLNFGSYGTGFKLNPVTGAPELDADGNKIQVPVTGWLKGVIGPESSKLTDSLAFTTLGFLYYGAGAVASGIKAFDDKDTHSQVLDSLEAFGNALNALKPVFEAELPEQFSISLGLPGLGSAAVASFTAKEFAEEAAAVGSGVGLAAAIVTAGWAVFDGIKHQEATANDNINFLMAGAGLSYENASSLAQLPYGSTSSLSKTMIDYAAYNKVSPESPDLRTGVCVRPLGNRGSWEERLRCPEPVDGSGVRSELDPSQQDLVSSGVPGGGTPTLPMGVAPAIPYIPYFSPGALRVR